VTESNKTKLILKHVGSILFFVLSGLLILYILLEIFIPNTTIKVFQFKPYVSEIDTMSPVINNEDLVIIYNANTDELEEGDIIAFMGDIDYDGTKDFVTHYIYSITTNAQDERIYRTIRHNGTVPDTWILRDADIIGVYGFRIPRLGAVVNFLKSPFGIAAVSVNVLVIAAIIVIVKSGKKENKDNIEQ
jgi:signal peptidase I